MSQAQAIVAAFAAMNRATDPVAWAVAAYRAGFATAEEPSSNPAENQRAALGYYEQASEVLTAERAPLEHARIVNAAGSAHRMLGNAAKALKLFSEAAQLMSGRASIGEEASVLNNLGLAFSEAGHLDKAVEAFNKTIAILPTETDEHIRTLLATKHNLAQTHLAAGGVGGCDSAIAELNDALKLASGNEVSMHQGMIWHTLGIAYKARAALEPADAELLISDAIENFERSLSVFTSVGFPFQHAIAKHNLGHAYAALDDEESLQRALSYYDDAMNIFDPRLHKAQWTEAFTNAQAVETRLAVVVPGASRADHIATLIGSMDEIERLAFLRQRFAQMERLPETNQLDRLTEFAHAVITQPPESFVATLRTMIMVLMELPDSLLQTALRAQLSAHAMLDPHDQRACDFVLEEAINLQLFGPQRIRVRDILAEIGWERP